MNTRSLITILFAVVFLSVVPIVAGKTEAAVLNFDKTTYTVNPGDVFQVQVNIDSQGKNLYATDVTVTYDPSVLQAQTISDGTFFPTVDGKNIDTTNKVIYFAGLADIGDFKTGAGTVGVINFKALTAATTTLAFRCDTTSLPTSKILDDAGNNIITCGSNGSASVTVGNGGSGSTTTGSTTTTTTTTGSTTTTGTTTSTPPSTLPRSGIAENIAKFSVPGIALIIIGGIIRLFLI